MKGPALQNKQVGVLRMPFRAREVVGTLEKRAPDNLTEELNEFEQSKIINFYQLSYGQSDIPRTEGFHPARKRKRMAVQSQ